MGGLFSSPKPPPAPAPVMPPTRDDSAVKDAQERQRKAAQNARGRASTVLTSDLGLTGSRDRPRLLGGT